MTNESNTQNFSGQVALVTGSRRGIGFGIALELAKEGFNIALNGTSKPAASKDAIDAIIAHNVDVEYIQADISSNDERRRLIDEIKRRFKNFRLLEFASAIV